MSEVCYSLRLTLSGAKAQLAVHIARGHIYDILAAVHPRHFSRRIHQAIILIRGWRRMIVIE